jgi:hypothetical protein
MKLLTILTVMALTLRAGGPGEIRLIDVTSEVKLAFKHENSPTSSKHLQETMGAGVALIDYDRDGRLDVFFTNGALLRESMKPDLKPDKSEPRFWNRLFRQAADGTFSDVTEKAGISGASDAAYTMGAAVGDYDNDGWDDLYVTAYESNKLYRNRGNGTFEDVTGKAGVAGSGWSSSAGWFDAENDGDLDLFVGRYLTYTFAMDLHCGEKKPGHRAYCHPDNYQGITNILFRNNGDGTFTDVSEKSGIANPRGKALGVAFADYDGDGFTDIYVANDSVQCFLYRNKGDGTFSEEGLIAGVGFNEDGKTFAGMGVDFADYDNDGKPDIVVTALSNESYVLYRNAGDGSFMDWTVKSGLGAASMLYSGWGLRFADLNNDGWKDLFVAQSHVLDTIEKTSPHLRYLQPPLLLRNVNGRFAKVELSGSLAGLRAGRGAAFGDLDNDGDVDVVVANCGEPAYVLRNDSSRDHAWLGLKLRGAKSNRNAIGAWVKVVPDAGPAQYFTVNTAGSYQSSQDPRVLAGLGTAGSVKQVEIRWPSGQVQVLDKPKLREWIEVTEPK